MKPIFLDTVGLIALWDQSDQWHPAAANAFELIIDLQIPLITTTFILLECGNASARRPYRMQVDLLREELASLNLLVFPEENDWLAAWEAYRAYDFDSAGIVDQTSFAVMRRLELTQAFTNDKHFRVAGFETLF